MTSKEIFDFFDNTTIEFDFKKEAKPYLEIFNGKDSELTKNRFNQLQGLNKIKFLNLYIPTARDGFRTTHISIAYDSQKQVIIVFHGTAYNCGFFEVEKNETAFTKNLIVFLMDEQNKIDPYKLKEFVKLKEIEPINKETSNEK